MRLLVAVPILLAAHSAAADEHKTCPEGQSREILTELIHEAVIEYETVTIDAIVGEGTELVTIPAQYEWIEKLDTYELPETLTFKYQELVPTKYKRVEIFSPSNFVPYNILLKLNGTSQRIDNDQSNNGPTPVYEYVIDTPKHYIIREKTIVMPTPIEKDGKLKVLIRPATTHVRDVPDVTKKEKRRIIKARKPAILREFLGECR